MSNLKRFPPPGSAKNPAVPSADAFPRRSPGLSRPTGTTPAITPGAPTERRPQAPAAPIATAPDDRHGPAQPARIIYGLERLRAAMKLSADVPSDEVCNDAVDELQRLRDQTARIRWPADR